MTAHALRMNMADKRTPGIVWVLLAAAALHGLMFIYDQFHPSVFFNADRALARWQAIQGVYEAWDADRLAPYLASHGIPGDYLLQAVLLAWIGKPGLILAQTGLALLGGFAVYRIGRLLGMARTWAVLASGVYLLLPHTLVFAHQLASEALYSPLLTISLWLTIASVAQRDARGLWLGATLAGIATLIRPVTLLWPLLPALAFLSAKRYRAAAAYAAVACLPIALWMAFMAGQTGSIGLGQSDHDMAHNLYQRTARMVETLPPAGQAAAKERYLTSGTSGVLGVGEYLKFGLQYPALFLSHSARDSVIFMAKSGLERIPIDYLLLNAEARAALQDADSGWRKRLEREGPGAALGYLWRTQGAVLIASLVGSILLLAMMGLALLGALGLLKRRAGDMQGNHAALLLVALPLYVFVFSQVVDAMQSRHRAPAEGALVLLAIAGAAQVRGIVGRNRSDKP